MLAATNLYWLVLGGEDLSFFVLNVIAMFLHCSIFLAVNSSYRKPLRKLVTNYILMGFNVRP